MGKGKNGRKLPERSVSRLSTTGLRRLRAWSVGLGLIAAIMVSSPALALEAPNGPGLPSVWAPAAKDFIGTSASTQSRVYFTGAEGVLTEVFYPTLDRVQNVDLQFLVTDAARTWGDEERRQQRHDISLVNKRAMVWQVVTTADSGTWRLTKKVFTDPGRATVIQRMTFETLEPGKRAADYNLYVLNNPAINNSGCGGDYQLGPDNSQTLLVGGRLMLAARSPTPPPRRSPFPCPGRP